jgi:hypothetical protein
VSLEAGHGARVIPSMRTSGRKVNRGYLSTSARENRSMEASLELCGCCTFLLHRPPPA